jgi:DNA-binding protein
MAETPAAQGGRPSSSDNTIYIGKKPIMNYVLAVVTQINGGATSVVIKARGNSISKAVDVADIVRKRFLMDLKDPSTDNITIGSEELANEDGTKSKVSYIQIVASTGRPIATRAASQDSTVYIGKKPIMNYVLAVVTQVNSGIQSVTIKARGNSISRAVDVIEIARRKFLPNVVDPSGEGIVLKSEEMANEDGTRSKVSSIQINIKK